VSGLPRSSWPRREGPQRVGKRRSRSGRIGQKRTFTRVAERVPLFDESQHNNAAESLFDGARDSCRPRAAMLIGLGE
jgi:hypothetical protein